MGIGVACGGSDAEATPQEPHPTEPGRPTSPSDQTAANQAEQQGTTEDSAVETSPGTVGGSLAAEPALLTWLYESRVVYPGAPRDPHRLRVHFADANHGRLHLASDPEVQGRRTLYYLAEGLGYVTQARSAQSQALDAPAQTQLRQQMALRDALFAQPLGDHWELQASETGSSLASWQRKATDSPNLRAWSDGPAAAWPNRIDWIDTDGQVVMSLEEIQWNRDAGQPVALRFTTPNGTVWQESDIALRRGMQLRPSFFLPPDRRKPDGQGTETLPIDAPRDESRPGSAPEQGTPNSAGGSAKAGD